MSRLAAARVGAVVIGRNEGERLKRCLESTMRQIAAVVYVDSGSSDGSPAEAASRGASVVELDLSLPFSAGRARNEGFKRLRELAEGLRYVQFVDGDCELREGWAARAADFLDGNEAIAVAFGRISERFPEESVYNWLCDVEWRSSPGEASSCGGIFLIRAAAFAEVGGFNPSMMAGEEPELCYRLRRSGKRLFALPDEMAVHDADIRRFSQWWRRTMRGGLAYAQGYYLHRGERHPHHLRQNRRILLWALALPLAALIGSLLAGPAALLLLLLYPLQLARLYLGALGLFHDRAKAFSYAAFSVLEKFPQFAGQLLFLRRQLLAERPSLIEYK